jgi:hypothetical protein
MHIPETPFILFHAPFPYDSVTNSGMYVRIAAIDAIFAASHRIYFWEDPNLSSFTIYSDEPAENCTYYCYNPFIAEHRQFIYSLAKAARFIYCHTQYYTYPLVHLLPTNKVVVDLHGIPPEESLMEGQPDQATYCNLYEPQVVQGARLLVSVTQSMLDHLAAKHGPLKPETLVLPIRSGLEAPDRPTRTGKRLRLIYAGDTAVWQKIDLMLETIAKLDPQYFEIILYTRKREELEKMLRNHNLSDRVAISSYSPADAAGILTQADLGFVLRDDSPVNRAACPTKLMEYLQFGVVPVVAFTDIGDFARYNYKFIDRAELIEGPIARQDLEDIRLINYEVYSRFDSLSQTSATHLQTLDYRRESNTLPIVSSYDSSLIFPLYIVVTFTYTDSHGPRTLEVLHLSIEYNTTFTVTPPSPGFSTVECRILAAPILIKNIMISLVGSSGAKSPAERFTNFETDCNGYAAYMHSPTFYKCFSNTDTAVAAEINMSISAVRHELTYYTSQRSKKRRHFLRRFSEYAHILLKKLSLTAGLPYFNMLHRRGSSLQFPCLLQVITVALFSVGGQ